MLRPREELQTYVCREGRRPYVSKVFDVYGLPCQRERGAPAAPRPAALILLRPTP